MPDAEHGAPGGGQGSGMGSGHGSGNQGGGNPADANNPGVSTGIEGSSGQLDSQGGFGASTDHSSSAEADANRDAMRGWDSSPGRSRGLGSPTGSHPDTDPTNNPGIGYGIQDVDIDVDYGYYDSPIEDYAGQSIAMQDLSVDAWDSPNTHFSPMEFGPQHQMSLSTQQLGQNVTVGYGPQRTAQMDDIDAMMEQQERARTMSQLDATMDQQQRARTMSQIDSMMEAKERQALNSAVTPDSVPVGPTNVETELEANPNLISRYDQKQFYSALDDEDATEETKVLEIQGFLDHINRKNYTDTGFFSKLGLRSPQLSQRQQIGQIENFLGKHQSAIDALNKSYTDQVNANPGLRQAAPGYGLITGLMSLIGLEPQHTHPAVQDLYDKMAELGMIEKETPEMTDAQKIEKCNATPGYQWDSAKHACVKIEDESTTSSTETASVASPEQAGIVWKPVSESDGNLVILTPSSFDSASVTITDAEGNVIDTGRSMGRTNGNRHTYRFSMPGAGYGSNVYLNIGSRRYLITDPAARVN